MPVQVVDVLNSCQAVIELEGLRKEIDTSLVKDIKEGDYLLLHSGAAIKKMDQGAAARTLQAFRNLASEMEEQDGS